MNKQIIKLLKKLIDADKHKCVANYDECIKEAKLIIKENKNETATAKNTRRN